MKTLRGDLIALAKRGAFDVIVHGCNCFCTFGAGIAKTIKTEFPSAFAKDCETAVGDRNKLGSITCAVVHVHLPNKKSEVEVEEMGTDDAGSSSNNQEEDKVTEKGSRWEENRHELTVVNAYTQYHWRKGGKVKADYDAIREAFQAVKSQFSGKRIAYPKIGCGLAGGDWSVVTKILEEELEGEDHTYVEFVPPPKPTASKEKGSGNKNKNPKRSNSNQRTAKQTTLSFGSNETPVPEQRS